MELSAERRERLLFEVSGIGRLLNGFGDWFLSRAPAPTYNRRAEIDDDSRLMRGGLLVEG
jgi:hypothetical protein